MPCSICHQKGHNKRTCPNVLISFKEVEAKPTPLTIEGALTLLCREFQLPEEVEKLISKRVFWGDYKPNFLSFTCSPNEWINEDYIVARRERGWDWETNDDPRYWSVLDAGGCKIIDKALEFRFVYKAHTCKITMPPVAITKHKAIKEE